jgi:hypothetical protein
VPRSRADTLALGLALALAACSGLDQPPTTATAADSADQIGFGLVHYMTADGVRRLRLLADSA